MHKLVINQIIPAGAHMAAKEKCILYINAAQQLCNASLGIATIGLLDEDF